MLPGISTGSRPSGCGWIRWTGGVTGESDGRSVAGLVLPLANMGDAPTGFPPGLWGRLDPRSNGLTAAVTRQLAGCVASTPESIPPNGLGSGGPPQLLRQIQLSLVFMRWAPTPTGETSVNGRG
jgi:hypothetical protein